MHDEARNKILETNTRQATFYDSDNEARITNLPMRSWRFVRRRMYRLMDASNIWDDVYRLQKEWIGDLADKKVLDFGCFEGNKLSHYLAKGSVDYLGIDLSQPALDRLAQSFSKKGITGARVQAVDILSREFVETGFDIIYAQGVLHHFNPIEALLPILHDKLNPGGRIVSLDPLRTSVLTRSVRAVYHPFRSDKDWEWPFRREIFGKFRQYFTIEHMQGVLGKSKWAIPLAFVNKDQAVRLVDQWHQKDMARATAENRHLWGCLQLAMCMRKAG
jgi:SAM-dependent methyltransferase